DCPNSRTRGRIDNFKSVIGKDPVLTCDRNNIGPYGRSNKIEIWNKNLNGKLSFDYPCLHQFKPNSAAAQFFIRIITIFPLWVEYGDSFGNFRSRPVMVTNNEIYILLRSVCNFVYSFNATV